MSDMIQVFRDLLTVAQRVVQLLLEAIDKILQQNPGGIT